MTIPDWLNKTELTPTVIAEKCGVDVSQVTRWKNEGNVPQGVALVELIRLSKGKIRLADIPVRKRGPKPKAA